MTVLTSHVHQKRQTRVPSVLFSLGVLFLLLLVLRNTALAAEGIRKGLAVCAQSLLPSLFPFMVLSEMAAGCGLAEALPKRMLLPLQRALRLSQAGAVALLLGLVFGFPIGTRYAIRSYQSGRLGSEECARLLPLTCTASPAFLISVVGGALWKDTRFGLTLYATSLLSILLVGSLCARYAKIAPSVPATHVRATRTPAGTLFTGAVRTSAEGMLLICSYVLFFASLSETIGTVLSSFSVPRVWSAALTALLELTGGANASATLPRPIGIWMTLLGCTWSGLSIQSQTLALGVGTPLSYRRLFLTKLLQTCLSVPIFWTLARFF